MTRLGLLNKKNFYLILGLAAYIGFLWIYVNRSFPYIGHDYRYFLSRMLDVQLHTRENGFAVQWFSPSFGGGLPAYFNPQHTQYTLAQFFTLLLDPWKANLISMGFFTAIGYVASYRFCRDILEESWQAAVLGALFFTTSGFYIERMTAGHFGYQAFPLIAAIFYFLFSSRFAPWVRGVFIGLFISINVFNGGFYLIAFLGFTFLLMVSVILLIKESKVSAKDILTAGVIGLAAAGLFSAGKVYAVLRFLDNFPRLLDMPHYTSLPEAILGFGLQFAGVPLLLGPYYLIHGGGESFLQFMLDRQAEPGKYGLWELDTSFSPVLFVIIIWFVVFSIREAVKGNLTSLTEVGRKRWLYLGLLAASIWITFQYATARGLAYSLLAELPIFGSLHTVRTAVSFALPGAVVGSWMIEKILQALPDRRKVLAFNGIFFGTLFGLLLYFLLPAQAQHRYADVRPVFAISARIAIGEEFFVKKIRRMGVDPIREVEVFEMKASSLETYEAIFGYDQSKFKGSLVAGPIFQEQDGKFNLNDPRSMILGEDDLFTRFSVSDRAIMTDFANYQQPDWDLPAIFYVLNYLSLVSVILGILTMIWYFFGKRQLA